MNGDGEGQDPHLLREAVWLAADGQADFDEPGLIREALSRGADPDSIVELVLRRRYPSAPRTDNRVTSEPLADFVRPTTPRTDFCAEARAQLHSVVRGEQEAYLVRVDAEFEALKPLVRAGFGGSRAAYREIRVRYYRLGWRCPKEQILDDIIGPDEGASLLGSPIGTGIHRTLQQVFDRVAEGFEGRPGLADWARSQVFSIGGFVPRLIDGSSDLSNHAFGLAVDLDPGWNPQIKSAQAIAAMRQATGFDFGKALYPASETGETAVRSTLLDQASERFRTWAARVFPAYETARTGLKALRAKTGQGTKEERAAARAALEKAKADFAADPDLTALQALIAEFREPTVRAWAAYGIQTIPLALIEYFKRAGERYGARWGGEYERTKDVMHLELLAPRTIPRDGSPTRGIEDLARGRLPRAPVCER